MLSPCCYSIRLENRKCRNSLTSIDVVEGYGQIAAPVSAEEGRDQIFRQCCRRATGGDRIAASGNGIAQAQASVLRPLGA
jgi:hypothetical protein